MITGESFALDDDFISVLGRRVEGGHKQMHIGSEGLHDGHLVLRSTNDGSYLGGGLIIDIQPCWQRTVLQGLEMTKDALGGPCAEILRDALSRADRLEAE